MLTTTTDNVGKRLLKALISLPPVAWLGKHSTDSPGAPTDRKSVLFPQTPNAHQLLCNGRYKNLDKEATRAVKQEIKQLWSTPPSNTELSSPFTTRERETAIGLVRCEKAMGPDKIPPEFLKHSGSSFRNWLRRFFSIYLQLLVIPKIWRKALVVAIFKPKKSVDNPKSYRPISLLCVSFKVVERLLLARLEPIVEPALPATQAGVRAGRFTTDQTVHLTDDIENGFEELKKAGLVLVDLIAAYDTVWHSGLTSKILHVFPDHHMVHFLCELVSNRRFTLQTNDGRLSRPHPLKNGVPQGSILSPRIITGCVSLLDASNPVAPSAGRYTFTKPA